MKQISHVEKMRAVAQSNKEVILALLGWDELQYCEFQEQQGREYLRVVICPDGYGTVELGNSRIFWRWWINQWNRRDDDFLNSGTYLTEREWYGNLVTYFFINTPEFLQGQYPHRVVFEASYSVMMGEFLDAK
jgi:hypothetical protein